MPNRQKSLRITLTPKYQQNETVKYQRPYDPKPQQDRIEGIVATTYLFGTQPLTFFSYTVTGSAVFGRIKLAEADIIEVVRRKR